MKKSKKRGRPQLDRVPVLVRFDRQVADDLNAAAGEMGLNRNQLIGFWMSKIAGIAKHGHLFSLLSTLKDHPEWNTPNPLRDGGRR